MQTITAAEAAKITDSKIEPGALFVHLADAYIVFDANRRAVFANAAYLRLLEQDSSNVIGYHIDELPQFATFTAVDEGGAWLRSALEEMEMGETRSTPYFRFDLAKAEEATHARFWKFKASLIPNLSDDATASGHYFAIRVSDVTEQAQRDALDQREKARLRSQAQLRSIVANETAAQLRASQDQFEVALAFAKVGAWELNPVSGLIACTDQCKVNLGLGIDESLSEARLFTEIIATEDRERVRARMEQALADRGHFEAEYRLEPTDGEIRWLLVRGQGKYDEAGHLLSVLGFTIDITARKEAELKQQREAASERDAREQSERNVLAMDHFVSAVTHELRSPLGAITSWAELLGRTHDPLQIQQAAGSLQRNARQLNLMVDDLLDTGAIVSGKLSVQRAPVELDILARHIISDLILEAQRKGLQLTCELTPCAVLGDEPRLKQIVWNLLSNAIKFTHDGAINVSVGSSTGWAVISVADTGCGIAPVALSRVFDRFEQVRTDVAGRIGGLGLGLWLVKSLVEMHAGKVAVESDGVGHGATFRVYLPLLGAPSISATA
ncbi:ATP-binding protein [Caballeronia sp. DA-9]|uniref:PAS domain-containing sensor histidine kinase n=1 Tax=Caballeronia sp. DA-9 TaxID=3436237 RepID=UPI003F66F757